jgi:hypothetical protein
MQNINPSHKNLLPEGTPQILVFDSFRNLMKTKYDQDIIPTLNSKLQILSSDQKIFSFKVQSTNPEKFHIKSNICLQELNKIFKNIVQEETVVLSQVRNLKQIMTIVEQPKQTKRSILDLVLGPSTTEIRQKGTIPCATSHKSICCTLPSINIATSQVKRCCTFPPISILQPPKQKMLHLPPYQYIALHSY